MAGTVAEICPTKPETVLGHVDVFDGSQEEMATLVPDEGDDISGYWQLDYVYAAGRFVTIRCKYKNGETLDKKLLQKINECNYSVDKNQALKINCQ